MNNVEAIYPLSPSQQGMLFHSVYNHGSGEYIAQFVCTLYGELDVRAFRRAWERVLQRHPVLQSAFVWEGQAEALQVVCRQVELPWQEQDWRGLSRGEQGERLEAYISEDRRRGFDLVKPPLMRCALFQIDDAYQFVWTQHHLLMDGWSRSIVLKELLDLYEAFSRSREPELPLPRAYKHYIAWLRRQDLSKPEAFWRQMLEGFSAPTPLLTVAPDNDEGAGTDSSGKQELYLSAEATAGLTALSRQHKLTLNTIVQGAWSVLLSRYSGDSDVLFGATVSGRPPELEGAEFMVGVMINVLPVRVKSEDDDQLVPWLKCLQSQQVQMREHEHSPLVQVQGWSNVPHGVPMFESILTFENYPVDAALKEWKGSVGIKDVRILDKTNYPLIVTATPGALFALALTYDRGRFDDTTMSRMLDHLRVLLEGMAANPLRRLGELPMLTPQERERLVVEGNKAVESNKAVEGNSAEVASAGGSCLHELFEEQARRRPEAPAAVCEGMKLSYGELNRQANRIAHHLRSRGVKPGALVGLCVERSAEMIVGLLGILKAGAAYLPLDPEYPVERLRFMLEDSRASALLTNRWQKQNLGDHDCRTICFDGDIGTIAIESEENPAGSSSSSDLAYVIYTSGSTGKPKGVLVSHANVTRLFTATRQWFDFSERDVWTMFHSYAFDFSVWELWGALLHGGRLVVVPYATSRSPEDFYKLLCVEGVTVLNQTPSAFRQLMRAEESLGVDGRLALRAVIFGGEALEVQSLRPWVERHGDEWPRLVNMYGITETTVHVTYRPITRADVVGKGGSMIGTRIPDLNLHVLDRRLEPVPVHIAGEMFVGGAGVAWGYLNKPGLTAERFVPDPFSEQPGARLYRSGDLARRRPDGDLEYLGRKDHQVKIRGFRIEPGEIEATLKQHPAVRDAVVLSAGGVSGESHLVGYVVAAADYALTISELRSVLKESLPEYMVPSAFVMLDELPLTPNGKLDRQALPASDGSRPELESLYVAPRTELEQMIVNLWQEILQVEKVGVTDDFFELGGHSLLATRIISRLNKAFQIELSVMSIFGKPNAAALAAAVEETLLREVEELSETSPDAVLLDQEMLEQRDYWVEKLSGRPPRVGVPLDYRREGRREPDREVVEACLDPQLYAKLKELTGDSSLLLYAALLCAVKVCLARYAGDGDVVVAGSPALKDLGRANALAILTEVDAHESFRDLLDKLRLTLLDAYAGQEYPYERLATDLGLRASPFDVAVALEGFHGEMPQVGNGITMLFRPEGGKLKAAVEYDREAYRRDSIETLWRQFERVLTDGVNGGDRPIRELGRMSEAERQQVVEEWNETAHPYPAESGIHELFEQQARRTPDAVAVVSDASSLDYKELDRRANRLARHLGSLGVGRGDRVGIYMEHCPEVIVGLLAVLKAGAAFVPLEPAHPAARLSFILS
ncbi:MAG: amino acid adenylation domain-containing protein, partial [Pyrinomonadaceae bacterium]